MLDGIMIFPVRGPSRSRAGAAPMSLFLLATLACGTAAPPSPVAPAPRPAPVEVPARMVWPPALEPGATIAFVAPAGDLDRERMERARGRLEGMGYHVVQRDDLFAREGYLAGSDERRAEELMAAFRDPKVDAIFPGTGGYGTMRILDRLDYAFIRNHPKLVIGFSDITALHAALNRRAGLVTFHSPMPMWGLGSPEGMTPLAERWFLRALAREGGPWRYDATTLADLTSEAPAETGEDSGAPPAPLASWGHGRARGRLVGGNLSMISALEGTPYALDLRGAILILEDVREAPYRVDRMLRQLALAGELAQVRGVVLGQFTRAFDREGDRARDDPRYTIDGVLRQYFEHAGIPVLVSFPFGHVRDNVTVPLGAEVEIDADAVALTVLPGPDADGAWLPGLVPPPAPPVWRREAREVRPGLVLAKLEAGSRASSMRFQVVVAEESKQAAADAALARLEEAGFPVEVDHGITAEAPYFVRLPDFASRASAEQASALLARAGLAARVVEVGQDPSHPAGPWSARLLEVDPSQFRLQVAHSTDAAIGVETTRALAARRGALAAINGGYYVTQGLLEGDSTGLLKIDGRLLSEPDRGRGAVGFVERDGRVAPLFGRLALRGEARLADGTAIAVDGIDRQRGDDETILYTPEFHRTTLTTPPGLEVVVVGGRLVERRSGADAARIPADGWVLSLGARRALEVGERLRAGDPIAVSLALCPFGQPTTDCSATDAAWAEASDAVAAGPLLLRGGRPVVDDAADAFSQVFSRARHPRSALGVRADGTLLLLAVDGRQADRSVGMSIAELQRLLLELGAVEAINLDGGGSTTLVVEGEVVNHPSDGSGERANGDAILLFPRD